MRTRILTAAALMVLTTAPLAAQRGIRGPARGARVGPDRPAPGAMLDRRIETALAQREDLGLDDAQVADLESLRSEVETAFVPIREETEAIRSEARDRSGTRAEVQERMTALRARQEALRARADTAWAPLQARFEQLLPPLQRQGLQRARAGERRGVGMVGRRFDRGAVGGRAGVGRPALGRMQRPGRSFRGPGGAAWAPVEPGGSGADAGGIR